MTAEGRPTHPDEDAEARRPRRIAAGLVWLLVVEGLLALTTVPTLAWLLFLDATWRNVPLMVALGLPVGPAVSAALFAWRRFSQGHDDGAAQHFWRGYQLNWADALRVWVPSLTVLALLTVFLLSMRGGDASAASVAVGVVLVVLVAVWTAHALLVISLFSFRTRDVARVALYFVLTSPTASLRALAVVAAGVAAAWFVHPWLAVALGSVLTSLLWWNGKAIAAEVERRFVVGAAQASPAEDEADPAAEDEADPAVEDGR